jgi:hypothetical protein
MMCILTGSLRKRFIPRVFAVAVLALVAEPGIALAQDEPADDLALSVDPCADRPCRELTREERASFGRLLAGLIAPLPQPSGANYERSGLKSIQGLGSSFVSDEVRQSPAFPENVIDPLGVATEQGLFPRSLGLAFSYTRKGSGTAKAGAHRNGKGEIEVFDLKIEITGQPDPALVRPSAAARIIDSSASAFAWEEPLQGEEAGMAVVTCVLGEYSRERIAQRAEQATSEKLAPLRSIRVLIEGPSQEAQEILKKLDRKSLKSLIAPLARKAGGVRARGAN